MWLLNFYFVFYNYLLKKFKYIHLGYVLLISIFLIWQIFVRKFCVPLIWRERFVKRRLSPAFSLLAEDCGGTGRPRTQARTAAVRRDLSPHRHRVHVFSWERETSVTSQHLKFSAKRVAELDGSVSAFSRGLSRVSSLFQQPQRPGSSAQRPGKCPSSFLLDGVDCYRRQGAHWGHDRTCYPLTTGGRERPASQASSAVNQPALLKVPNARAVLGTPVRHDLLWARRRESAVTRPETLCRTAIGTRRRAQRKLRAFKFPAGKFVGALETEPRHAGRPVRHKEKFSPVLPRKGYGRLNIKHWIYYAYVILN